jgi:hypothetical protein
MVETFELQKFHLVFIEHSYVIAFIPHNIFTLKNSHYWLLKA